VRAVILTNRQGNQLALINKLAPHVEIASVVFSRNIPRRKPSFARQVRSYSNRVSGRLFGRRLISAWQHTLDTYDKRFSAVPAIETVDVDNINDDATIATIEKHSPELVLVSGTNIVGGRVIDAAQRSGRIMNLHTGISPYVKGGPNCTNWCLSKGWFHLIGNTVMWIDKGIDTGNIVATERTPLSGSEDLTELHSKVMEHAHDIYVRAVRRLASGNALPDIPQRSIADGVTFLSSQWTAREVRRALYNFDRSYKAFFSDRTPPVSKDVKLFPLTDD
jgi:folate-dependent phosphoribosylglycinamide formyltransferase PurN